MSFAYLNTSCHIKKFHLVSPRGRASMGIKITKCDMGDGGGGKNGLFRSDMLFAQPLPPGPVKTADTATDLLNSKNGLSSLILSANLLVKEARPSLIL